MLRDVNERKCIIDQHSAPSKSLQRSTPLTLVPKFPPPNFNFADSIIYKIEQFFEHFNKKVICVFSLDS